MKTFLCLLLFSSQVWAASWYVKPASSCANNGDGTATGCAASGGAPGAWKGSANIVWASVVAGDTIFVGGNWVATDCHDPAIYCFLVGKSGNVGTPITIDFTGSTMSSAFLRTKAVATSTFSNVTIKNLTATQFTTYGIDVNMSGVSTDVINVTIESPTIYNITSCAGECDGISGKGSGIVVHNAKINNIADDGIWTDGTGAVYYNDTNDGTYFVRDIGNGPNITGDCFQFSGSAGNDTNKVSKGYCDHRSTNEKQCAISNTKGVLTVWDTVCIANTYNLNGGSIGIYSEGRGDIQRNFLSGFNYGIDIAELANGTVGSTIIDSNVVVRFGWYGITTGSATPTGVTVTVANNTIDGTGSDLNNSRCMNLAGAAGATITTYNNIVTSCKFGYVDAGGAATKTIATSVDFANTTRYSGFATGSTNSDPRLLGGINPPITVFRTGAEMWRPTPNSTALIRMGTYYTSPANDLTGEVFDLPPSIGAFRGPNSSATTNITSANITSSNITSANIVYGQ